MIIVVAIVVVVVVDKVEDYIFKFIKLEFIIIFKPKNY